MGLFTSKKIILSILFLFPAFFSLHGDEEHHSDNDADLQYEKELYFIPGGKYSKDDIEANGNITPYQKFKAFRASHNVRSVAGDRLCPITHTKANPNCTWIIGGQSYQFCCPPCIDEFVRMAKEQPDEILRPEAYTKS